MTEVDHPTQAARATADASSFCTRTEISIVVPAYREEEAVGRQVESIREAMTAQRIPHEILVVDDGSGDRTAERALGAGARVVQHRDNQGYGAALKTGIRRAKHDTIVIIDADGTYPPDQIPRIVAHLENADMVVGARTGGEVHIPLMRRPAKLVLNWLAARVAGRRIPDLNSGLRAFRRDCVTQYFSILPDSFSWTTTITLALLADGYRVVYHSIDYHHRVGKSKIAPRLFSEFLILVLRMAVLFQPLRVFLPIAASCFALGALKVVFDILATSQRGEASGWSLLFHPVISTSAVLLLLVGLQLLLIGMVCDALLRRISDSTKPTVPSRGMEEFEVDPRADSEEEPPRPLP